METRISSALNQNHVRLALLSNEPDVSHIHITES